MMPIMKTVVPGSPVADGPAPAAGNSDEPAHALESGWLQRVKRNESGSHRSTRNSAMIRWII